MSTACQDFETQIKKVQETVTLLEERLKKVRLNLDKKPDDAIYRRELKQLNLDMKITMNELEHAQNGLECARTKRTRHR